MLQGHTGYLEGVGLHSLRGELEGTCVGICSVFQLHGDAQWELSSAADLPGHLSLCTVIIFHMAGWHWLLLCEAWGNRFMQVSCAQITAIRSLAVTLNPGSGLHHSPLACFSGSQRGEAAAKHLSPSPHTHTHNCRSPICWPPRTMSPSQHSVPDGAGLALLQEKCDEPPRSDQQCSRSHVPLPHLSPAVASKIKLC